MRKVFTHTILGATIFIVANLPVVSSMAQTTEQPTTCKGVSDPIEKIRICSKSIQTQRLPNGKPMPPKMLEEQYLHRGIGYSQISDFERAMSDYEKAGVPSLVFKMQLKINWLRYLKELQDEHDHSNWSGLPLDGFWAAK